MRSPPIWKIPKFSAYHLLDLFLSLVFIGLVACQPTVTATRESSIANSSTVTVAVPTNPTSSTSAYPILATITLDWRPTLIAQGNGLIWVVGREDHFVARLDPKNNQLLGPPTTFAEPIYDIVVGAGGVWVTGDTVVTRLDPNTGEISATLRADQFGDGAPFRLTIGDDLIWLLNLEQKPSGIHRIDPRTNRFVGETATAGIEAVGITFGAESIWTADHDDSTVSRIDPKTNQILATIKVPFEPHYIYFNPDDGMVWVANYHFNSVMRIDPQTNQQTGRTYLVPFAPEWMTSGQGKLWVLPSPYAAGDVRQDFEGLAEFDALHIREAKIIPVSGRPMDAVVSDGSLWVTTQDPSQILRFDLQAR